MKASGKLRPGDEDPVYPYSKEYLFDVFWDLDRRRQNNGFSSLPIAYRDIESYCNLMNLALTPWDIQMLCDIDDVMMKAKRVSSTKEAKAAGKK